MKIQVSRTRAIQRPLDEFAAVNAALGREMASAKAQMGITSVTRTITIRAGLMPKTSEIMLAHR